MALTNAGRDFVAQAAIAEAGLTAFDGANAHIGVGNSAGVFAATQTDLLGTEKFRKLVDATFPQRSANALTFRSTFATADANFAWEEWGVFNAAVGGTMLNRKVEALGTKPSTQAWQFTVTLTLSNP